LSEVVNIQSYQQSIYEIERRTLYNVPVLNGCYRHLVRSRTLKGYSAHKTDKGYYTNTEIKTYAVYFLLKSLTTSGKIFNWTNVINKSLLLEWCQMNENTFRSRLSELKSFGLCTIEKETKNITLVSYKKAADILGIEYKGTHTIKYNPYIYAGKQVFQYIIRAEEFRSEQQRQLEAFSFHLEKNPSLRNDLYYMLIQFGADSSRLNDAAYFAERLLQLQIKSFVEGSEILEYITQRCADMNRSVNKIQDDHTYKSKASVSYLKKKMASLRIINVQHVCNISTARSRLYIADGERKRDAYRWLKKQKVTAWVLCDQITFNIQSTSKSYKNVLRKTA